MRISKGFWIWGLFDPYVEKKIEEIKSKVNKSFNGPYFNAHLTLSGPILNLDNDVLSNFYNLENTLKSIEIKNLGYGMKEEFFQSLFLKIMASSELENLKSFLDNKFSVEKKPFFPHVSLFYGLEKEKDKKNMIDQLPQIDFPIVLKKISLTKVNEEIKTWEILHKMDLV